MSGLKRWYSDGALVVRDDLDAAHSTYSSAYTLHPHISPDAVDPLRAWLRQLAEAGKDTKDWLREGDQWMSVPYYPDAAEEAREIYHDLQDIAKAVQRHPTEYNRRNFDGAAGALRTLGIEVTGQSNLD